MLQPNPKQNLFQLRLPEDFWIPAVCERYNRYLRSMNGTFDTIQDLINESIQGVVLPGFSFDTIKQEYKNLFAPGNTPVQSLPALSLDQILTSNKLQITLRHTDAYLNYFCLLEHFVLKFVAKNDDSIEDLRSEASYKNWMNIPVTMLQHDGHPLFVAIFQQCYFTGIPELSLTHNKLTRDFLDFQIEFTFIGLDFKLNPPNITAEDYIPS